MRHLKRSKRLGRTTSHREAMLAAVVCGLIEEKRITTTLDKAREATRLAEKMVTLGREGTLAARRRAISILRRPDRVGKLFGEIVPQFQGRQGGYTRIMKLGRRMGDNAEMALVEWVGIAAVSKKKKKKKEEAKAAEKK